MRGLERKVEGKVETLRGELLKVGRKEGLMLPVLVLLLPVWKVGKAGLLPQGSGAEQENRSASTWTSPFRGNLYLWGPFSFPKTKSQYRSDRIDCQAHTKRRAQVQ